MKIQEIFDFVDGVKPNAFTNEQKIMWLNEVEGMVQTDVMLLASIIQYVYSATSTQNMTFTDSTIVFTTQPHFSVGGKITITGLTTLTSNNVSGKVIRGISSDGLTYTFDAGTFSAGTESGTVTFDGSETELLVNPPHQKIYYTYLMAMIDFANGEYDKYQNAMALFNTFFGNYTKWFIENYHPADGECETLGYYISAYAIAVKHGYAGTEEEWLASLEGDQAKSTTDAQTAAAAAETSAESAATSATAAGAYASHAATDAETATNQATISTNAASTAVTKAQEIVQSANDAALAKTAAESARDVAQSSASSASSSAQTATTKATEAATSAANAEAAKTAAEAATETKADKVDNATEGNFASLDTNGNLLDSGKKPTDYQTPLPDTTDNEGKILSINSGVLAWVAQVIGLPSMAGNAGKLLTTDGTNVAWGNAVQATAADQIGLIVKGASGQTAHLQDWQDGNSITKAYMTSSGMCMAQMFQPIVAGQGLCNINSSNNSNIVPGNSGTIISRNVADANSALIVNQINAASTGKILDLQFKSVSVLSVNTSGVLVAPYVVAANYLKVSNAFNPVSSDVSGSVGEIKWNQDYIYICTATNTWKRAAISTW